MRLVGLLLLIFITPAFAQTSDSIPLDQKDVPKSVAEQVACGGPENGMSRRPFAGGFVFTAQCPGNHANYIQALVYAQDEQGTHARLLMFRRPGKKSESNPADSLSNIRWFPQAREVTELFVDPESTICRTEGRWRLDAKAQPQLVYWRQTRDCEGKSGWRVVVDRRGR
jgi:hypothetical protein